MCISETIIELVFSPSSFLPPNPPSYVSLPTLLPIHGLFPVMVIACIHVSVYEHIFLVITRGVHTLSLVCTVLRAWWFDTGQSGAVLFPGEDCLWVPIQTCSLVISSCLCQKCLDTDHAVIVATITILLSGSPPTHHLNDSEISIPHSQWEGD